MSKNFFFIPAVIKPSTMAALLWKIDLDEGDEEAFLDRSTQHANGSWTVLLTQETYELIVKNKKHDWTIGEFVDYAIEKGSLYQTFYEEYDKEFLNDRLSKRQLPDRQQYGRGAQAFFCERDSSDVGPRRDGKQSWSVKRAVRSFLNLFGKGR